MRIKTVVLIIVVVLLGAFVALNLQQFTQPTTLNFGFTSVEGPLGMIMLTLLIITAVVFLATAMYMQRVNLIETRNYARELSAQRELADKAEASRFTELRNYLEAQATQAQQREHMAAAGVAERLARTQEALISRIEQSDNTTAAHMGQIADHLERNPRANTPLIEAR